MIILHNSLINSSSPSFKSAKINILAMADNHGCIGSMPRLIEAVKSNKSKIFIKPKEKSTLNVFAIAGDYYLSPDNTGLRTRPNAAVGDIQHDFLLKTISSFKSMLGKNSKLETLFTLGNHDLEGGAPWVLNKLKDSPVISLFSNVNISKSPLVKRIMKNNENFVTSKVYEIPDDKNPNLTNHALFMGITIPRKKFNSKKLEEMQLYDQLDKSDSTIERNDLLETYKVIKNKVQKFKKEHPDGAVVLLSHMGKKVSEFISEEVKGIDLILNAHDHLKTDNLVNNTFISCLGENNKFVKALNLEFDDFGKFSSIEVKKFDTENYGIQAINNKKLQQFVNKNVGEDLKPLVDLTEHQDLITELKYSKNIRYSNKLFVNYVTTGVKESLKNTYPIVDSVGIPSEVFRGGLAPIEKNKTYFDNLDLVKMFGGLNKDNSQLKIGEVTGDELLFIVVKNVLKNIENPKENGIIHWSDIQIDRTLIEKIQNKESNKSFSDAIKFRNPKTNKFVPLIPNKNYHIVLPDKFLLKEMKKSFMKNIAEKKFFPISETLPKLMKEYLQDQNYILKFPDKIKEQRII